MGTRAFIGAIAFVALAAPAAAQTPADSPPVLGFYLGAGAGGAVLPLDDNNDDFWDDNNAEGSAAFKAFVGYRFHQNFAIEAYYADLGDFEFRRNVFGGCVSNRHCSTAPSGRLASTKIQECGFSHLTSVMTPSIETGRCSSNATVKE
jgi:hypothetical protein